MLYIVCQLYYNMQSNQYEKLCVLAVTCSIAVVSAVMDFKKYIIIIIILASLTTTIREPHSKRIPTQLAVVICAVYVFPIHLEKFNHIDDEGGGFDLAFTTTNTVLTCEICSSHYLVRGMVCVAWIAPNIWPLPHFIHTRQHVLSHTNRYPL